MNIYEKFEYWCDQPLEVIAKAVKKTKEKKTPKSQDRGDVCFPANSKHNKSSKDRFPINNENQARNALARCAQYDSVPPWFQGGGLKELQNMVRRKVHSKYKGIEVSDLKKKKKSALEVLVEKYSENNTTFITKTANPQAFLQIVKNYEDNGSCVRDFAHALKLSAEQAGSETNPDDPYARRVHQLLLMQAKLVENIVSDVSDLDQEIQETLDAGKE